MNKQLIELIEKQAQAFSKETSIPDKMFLLVMQSPEAWKVFEWIGSEGYYQSYHNGKNVRNGEAEKVIPFANWFKKLKEGSNE
jgi:hypothetical protein